MNKKLKKTFHMTTFLMVMLFCGKPNAQEHIKDFFPHHVGDIWQRLTLPEYEFSEGIITGIDTVLSDTAYYIYYNDNTHPSWKVFLNDSSTLYFQPDSIWIPYYKVNIPIHTSWIYDPDPHHPSWLQYKNGDSVNVFGDNTSSIEYWYFGFEPDSTSELPSLVDKVAKNIGLYLREWEFGEKILLGCIINGVQYGDIVDNIETEKNNITVTDFKLNAYPNPFNGQVVIRYDIPKPTDISIKIYDLMGREIATLFEGNATKGKHHVKWEVNNAASSVYYVILTTKGSVVSHKLVLLK